MSRIIAACNICGNANEPGHVCPGTPQEQEARSFAAERNAFKARADDLAMDNYTKGEEITRLRDLVDYLDTQLKLALEERGGLRKALEGLLAVASDEHGRAGQEKYFTLCLSCRAVIAARAALRPAEAELDDIERGAKQKEHTNG